MKANSTTSTVHGSKGTNHLFNKSKSVKVSGKRGKTKSFSSLATSK